jgi:hypothetical protein
MAPATDQNLNRLAEGSLIDKSTDAPGSLSPSSTFDE